MWRPAPHWRAGTLVRHQDKGLAEDCTTSIVLYAPGIRHVAKTKAKGLI